MLDWTGKLTFVAKGRDDNEFDKPSGALSEKNTTEFTSSGLCRTNFKKNYCSVGGSAYRSRCKSFGNEIFPALRSQTSSQLTDSLSPSSIPGGTSALKFSSSLRRKLCHRPTCGASLPRIVDLNGTLEAGSNTAREHDIESA